MFLSFATKAILVQLSMLSTLKFFITISEGLAKALKQIHSRIKDFLWSKTLQYAHARVRWDDVCAAWDVDGLEVINP